MWTADRSENLKLYFEIRNYLKSCNADIEVFTSTKMRDWGGREATLYQRVTYNVEIRQVQQQRETLYPRVAYNVEIKQA